MFGNIIENVQESVESTFNTDSNLNAADLLEDFNDVVKVATDTPVPTDDRQATEVIQDALTDSLDMSNIWETVSGGVDTVSGGLETVNGIVGSAADIATGNIGHAADYVEESLSKSVPVVIGFLAEQTGLGGVGEKTRGIISSVQEKIAEPIDKLADRIGNKLFSPIL